MLACYAMLCHGVLQTSLLGPHDPRDPRPHARLRRQLGHEHDLLGDARALQLLPLRHCLVQGVQSHGQGVYKVRLPASARYCRDTRWVVGTRVKHSWRRWEFCWGH